MESTSDNRKMKCSLCEEMFPKTEVTIVYGKEIYNFCRKCEIEHSTALRKIERELSKLKIKKLKSWISKTRAVKRVYKNQLTLPGTERGDRDES